MIIIISITIMYTKVRNKHAVYKTSFIHVAGWVVSRAKIAESNDHHLQKNTR